MGLIFLEFGAAMACAASFILNYLPFVMLEGCWTLGSLVSLIRFMMIFHKKMING